MLMLREYISQLESENQEKRQSYEAEMQGLKTDLSTSKNFLEKLERERTQRESVFSPRSHDSEIDAEILDKQTQIQQLSQRIDRVNQLIEETEQRRQEYKALKEELNSDPSVNNDLPEKNFSPSDSGTVGSIELNNLVDEVCKKIDFAISLMSGNKNRSKAELKSAERLLKDYAQKECS